MDVIFRCEGITPFLMNNPASMLEPPPSGPTVRGQNPTAEEKAERCAYRLPSGQLYAPAVAFRGAMLGGSVGRRVGKRSATGVVKGAVFLLQETAPFFHQASGEPITEYEIDVRRVVIQRQAIPGARGKVDKWACDVPMEVDTDFIRADMALELLQIGGRICGVGDYRPEKSGPFGRFTARIIEPAELYGASTTRRRR